MSQSESDHQQKIRQAAVEQERERGVLANETSPCLSREARDRIRQRRAGSLKAAILDSSFPHLFNTFAETFSPTRPAKLTALYQNAD